MELRLVPVKPRVANRRTGLRQLRRIDVGEEEVLLVGRTQIAFAVPRSDLGRGERLRRRDTARDDRDADPVLALLLLTMDAEMVLLHCADRIGEGDGGLRGPAKPPDQLLTELFRAPI